MSPNIIFKVIMDYYIDINRFKKRDFKVIEKYRDKNFRKLVKTAFNIPIYKEKFKEINGRINSARNSG